MELKLNIGYQELLELVKQLPLNQQVQLKAQLPTIPEPKKMDLKTLLLNGPVMDDEQYEQFLENRKHFNAWRT